MEEGKRTSLERLEPIVHRSPLSLPLLNLGRLNFLSKLLKIPLLPRVLALFDTAGFGQESLADAFHVVVGFDHLGVEVGRTGEGEGFGLGELTGEGDCFQGLLIAVRERSQ